MLSHLDLAHLLWDQILCKGDWVLDATCGNGHDTLFCAERILPNGKLFAIDIQKEAIEKSQKKLQEQFSQKQLDEVHFQLTSHDTFLKTLPVNQFKLIIYNLGYLPGGDKSITTQTQSTLQSVLKAQELILEEGLISITCYPGHEEGKKEQIALEKWASTLPSNAWRVQTIHCTNLEHAPSLLLLSKKKSYDGKRANCSF